MSKDKSGEQQATSLRAEYLQLKESLPCILESKSGTVTINGIEYHVDGYSLNPYTIATVESYTWPCDPVELTDAERLGVLEYQKKPNGYVAIVSAYDETPDGQVKITVHGSTQSSHKFLGGSMLDAGVSPTLVTAAHNLGHPIRFINVMGVKIDTRIRYKFDMNYDPRCSPDPDYYYHAWAVSPLACKLEEAKLVHQRIIDISQALDLVLPELAKNALKIDNEKVKSRMMIMGSILKDHGLESTTYR